MKYTEDQIVKMAKPISETEDAKCQNAIKMIRDAIRNPNTQNDGNEIKIMFDDTHSYSTSLYFNNRKIKIFVQGSYANKTNVRQDSDVDVAIMQTDVFNGNYRAGVSYKDYNFVNSDDEFQDFKIDIINLIKSKFNSHEIKIKNKCIKITGNSYRVNADAVPCREYRDYSKDYSYNENNCIVGMYLYDGSTKIINYPMLHIENGIKKNTETQRMFKRMVRIIKTIRNDMARGGLQSAKNVSSFGLESLLWNIPEGWFTVHDNYPMNFQEIVNFLVGYGHNLHDFYEVNGIKKLCSTQHDFNCYKNFIDDLNIFYNYMFSR